MWGCNAADSSVPTPYDWKVFEGRGYTLSHPDDWRVSETEDHRIRFESEAGSFSMTSVNLPGVQANQLTPALIQACTGSSIDPSAYRQASPFSMNASREQGGRIETAAVQFQQAGGGLALMCAATSAEADEYEYFAETVGEVLATLKPASSASGPARTNAPSRVDWTQVPLEYHRDPEEGAFTVGIPRGWSFKGGTGRAHILETRQWFLTSSPDGEIHIIMGDVDVPRFIERDPFGMASEGQWYTTQFSGSFLIMRFQHGLDFAKQRVQQLFGNYPDFKYEEQTDVTRQYQQAFGQYGGANPQNLTAGMSGFSFSHEGRKMAGVYVAVTMRYPEFGNWGLTLAQRIITTEDRIEESVAILKRIDYQIDQRWQQQQDAGAMASRRVMTEHYAETNRMMRESYERRSASSDRIQRNFVDAIWEVQRLEDPTSGKRYEMQYGSMSYWIDNNETRVGIDGYDNPNPLYFRELLKVRD